MKERRNVAAHWNGRNCKIKLQRKKEVEPKTRQTLRSMTKWDVKKVGGKQKKKKVNDTQKYNFRSSFIPLHTKQRSRKFVVLAIVMKSRMFYFSKRDKQKTKPHKAKTRIKQRKDIIIQNIKTEKMNKSASKTQKKTFEWTKSIKTKGNKNKVMF